MLKKTREKIRRLLKVPKFHDRYSLAFGYFGGLMALVIALFPPKDPASIIFYRVLLGIAGLVLMLHCADMLKTYQKHRIIKIVKTDTHRMIYKK